MKFPRCPYVGNDGLPPSVDGAEVTEDAICCLTEGHEKTGWCHVLIWGDTKDRFLAWEKTQNVR